MRIALDTNILVYAEGAGPDVRCDQARRLLTGLSGRSMVLPTQVLGEFYNVLTRKARLPSATALDRAEHWSSLLELVAPDEETVLSGLQLAVRARLQVWDAIVISTASQARCDILLTEDLQDGFVHGGVTLIDPFAPTPHPLLADALQERP